MDDLGGAGEDEDDEDLEAELAALTSGGNTTVKEKRKSKSDIDFVDDFSLPFIRNNTITLTNHCNSS